MSPPPAMRIPRGAHGAQHQPYTVKAFTIQVFDPGGNLSKSISLPMQSGHESIVYQITI